MRSRVAILMLVSTYDRLLVFVWDNGAHSEDHALVREGMRKYDRVVDAVIVSRPGHMADEAVMAAEPSGVGDAS